MPQEKYIFVVPQKALIRKGKEILILKRSSTSKTFPEHWDLPGGKLEHGETPEVGIEREVLEETGLVVRALHPLFLYVQKVLPFYSYISVIECKLEKGSINLSDEHSEFCWKTKEEIISLQNVHPYLKEFLRKSEI